MRQFFWKSLYLFVMVFLTLFGGLYFIIKTEVDKAFKKNIRPKLRLVSNGHWYEIQEKYLFSWEVQNKGALNRGQILSKTEAINTYENEKQYYERQFAKFEPVFVQSETDLGETLNG